MPFGMSYPAAISHPMRWLSGRPPHHVRDRCMPGGRGTLDIVARRQTPSLVVWDKSEWQSLDRFILSRTSPLPLYDSRKQRRDQHLQHCLGMPGGVRDNQQIIPGPPLAGGCSQQLGWSASSDGFKPFDLYQQLINNSGELSDRFGAQGRLESRWPAWPAMINSYPGNPLLVWFTDI
jgi:hypothetical protein